MHKEVLKEQDEFWRKRTEFEDKHNKVIIQNEALQEELDKYCIEKEKFEVDAQSIKDKGEADQLESEQIGYFKANKERLKEELKALAKTLDKN